jgi:hypothetical protein
LSSRFSIPFLHHCFGTEGKLAANSANSNPFNPWNPRLLIQFFATTGLQDSQVVDSVMECCVHLATPDALRSAHFMPEVSRFFGIVIHIYYREHGRPHFHAVYGEYKAVIDIESGDVTSGKVPKRVLALIQEWYALHQAELAQNAGRADRRQPLAKIKPLE